MSHIWIINVRWNLRADFITSYNRWWQCSDTLERESLSWTQKLLIFWGNFEEWFWSLQFTREIVQHMTGRDSISAFDFPPLINTSSSLFMSVWRAFYYSEAHHQRAEIKISLSMSHLLEGHQNASEVRMKNNDNFSFLFYEYLCK